ncbi:hypothetical protein A6E13_11295 [Aliivibrio fischeri]|uniref:STAS-like domain-containing protein n=1 Tax=Aliivibrio fischeri TaxID=668 RepID=UPI00080E28D9|nr:STAS-like domain-containing protein [Aliivibrio fischeri]OCH32990.1 hypothetical protein A6E13_11295 [Aliivibrio fischeri]
MKTYNIGTQFNDEPASRYYTDTKERSAEVFRERVLKPLLISLTDNEKITFILDDGVEGYGSSFITESFAGLVKYGYITKDELKNKLHFKYSNSLFEFYKDRIYKFIDKAKYNSVPYKPTSEEVSTCVLNPDHLLLK